MRNIILAMCFIFVRGYSQCDFRKNEIDDFTKKRVIQTRPQGISDEFSEILFFEIYYDEPQFKFGIAFSTKSKLLLNMTPQQETILMLNNDEQISFHISENKVSGISQFGTFLEAVFPIDEESLNRIRSIGVKKVRFGFQEKNYDFDVKNKKWIRKFNEKLDCLINEVHK
jgi:hypothetical protein